jgi:small-conductance mechanosensitive channel
MPGEKEDLHKRTAYYLKKTAASNFADVDAFETENYRRLQPAKHAVIFDGVREVLRMYLPKQISWSREEKAMRKELSEEGIYKPETLSSTADRIARFIVAMGSALFVLVPMYVMALNQSLTKNLVTTTVALVLFVLVCSVPLNLANDQIFSSTFGYAAVLVVFVRPTSSPQQLSG